MTANVLLEYLLTLALQVIRDVRDRGRDVEGCIKQWFGFVKPNFEKVSSLTQPSVLGGR
jgi:uridine kinase